MRRAVTILAAGLALLAVAPASATIQIVPVSLEGAQTIADALLKLPQFEQALPEGAVVVIRLGESAFSGAVRAGGLTLVEGDAPAADLVIGMSRDAAVSILNAYNRPNTVKMLVRGGFVSASGNADVNAGLRLVQSGAVDDLLKIKPPAAGEAIKFRGEKGTLRPLGDAFVVRLGDHDYLVDSVGGVIADLGPSDFRLPPPGANVLLDEDSGASFGVQPLDEGCVADDASYLLWAFTLTACEWAALSESGGMLLAGGDAS